MSWEGVVHNGVIVPDDATPLVEGMRVQFHPAIPNGEPTFGERFGEFKGVLPELPADLAEQHESHRLGTPKR